MAQAHQHLQDYFEIVDNFNDARAWFLDKPRLESNWKLDVWAFTAGQPLRFEEDLVVPIQTAGYVTDITFSHYSIPYVHPRIGKVLEAFAEWDIQRVPARLETGEEIEILNVLTVLDAFDRQRSDATYKGDKPNMVLTLRINPQKADGHHVFRLKGWEGSLIVSGLILEQLRRIGASGFLARKVS